MGCHIASPIATLKMLPKMLPRGYGVTGAAVEQLIINR